MEIPKSIQRKLILGLLMVVTFTLLSLSPGVSQPDSNNQDELKHGNRAPYAQNRTFEDPFESEEDKARTIPDPIEPWNRGMFWFNDRAYEYVAEPVARGYHDVLGAGVRRRIQNVFQNLDEPRNFVNGLLQAKPRDAGVSLTRFLVNSTVGLAGVFDPASASMERKPRRLDQTFAKWGVSPGMYLVWPFYGPSSPRGTIGQLGDGFLYPPYYLDGEDAIWVGPGLYAHRNINYLSLNLGLYGDFKSMAVDPYSGLKNAYEQKLNEARKK